MSSSTGKNSTDSPGINKFMELIGDISDIIVSGINTEKTRYNQETTRTRFRQAFRSLKDASDNMEWIAINELRLISGRARLIQKEISHAINDYVSQATPKQ